MSSLTDEQIEDLYMWVDEIPLSRPKRNIARDFSDAVLAAEVIKYYIPKMVDLHNYPPSNGISQKVYNWNTLSQKTLKRMNIHLSEEMLMNLASAKPGCIEYVLNEIRNSINSWEKKAYENEKSSISVSRNSLSSKVKQSINQLDQHKSEREEILELKVEKLQKLLELKEQKIQELLRQVNRK